ncbi:Na+/H+ antiporter subunit E [Noviherbaspirillum sp.]|uniref:Na+/H+ antiporter subunit E n=1 Tax=Noviherbaspirillum sp. TaxID=1926288 RepID=UPI002D5D5DD0|nr:Na+/H+ antiporter subunit E [Noviherbaspirillum sp.]HZW22712.1 Na+/H+ antiporter subunit E [Noviherbaspirillum sp.]
MKTRAFFLRTLFYGALWWVMTEGSPDGLALGASCAGLAALLSLQLHPPTPRRLKIAGIPGFVQFFIVRSIRGGAQVAATALKPRLELRPGILDIPLRLRDEPDQLFLAGVLNLMPGTLAAGLDQGRLQLHVLDRYAPIQDEVREAEARVAGLFGVELS